MKCAAGVVIGDSGSGAFIAADVATCDHFAPAGWNFHASVFSSVRGTYVMPSRVAHRLTWKCSGMTPVSLIASSVARCR